MIQGGGMRGKYAMTRIEAFGSPRSAEIAESIWTDQQMEGVLMSRRPARFTQGDVARAIRAAKAAGAPSLQIKPDGTIIVNLLKSPAVQETDEAVEPEEHFVL